MRHMWPRTGEPRPLERICRMLWPMSYYKGLADLLECPRFTARDYVTGYRKLGYDDLMKLKTHFEMVCRGLSDSIGADAEERRKAVKGATYNIGKSRSDAFGRASSGVDI